MTRPQSTVRGGRIDRHACREDQLHGAPPVESTVAQVLCACGTGFPNACKCGFVNTAEDRFCGGCGNTVRATFRVEPLAEENVTMKIAIEELMPAEK